MKRVFLKFILFLSIYGAGVSVGECIQSGGASWYGAHFHGRSTASGKRFDMNALTAAHKTLPLGSLVRVVRRDTGDAITVTINDRGPYIKGRVIDLSYGAAQKLNMVATGSVPVEIYLIK